MREVAKSKSSKEQPLLLLKSTFFLVINFTSLNSNSPLLLSCHVYVIILTSLSCGCTHTHTCMHSSRWLSCSGKAETSHFYSKSNLWICMFRLSHHVKASFWWHMYSIHQNFKDNLDHYKNTVYLMDSFLLENVYEMLQISYKNSQNTCT